MNKENKSEDYEQYEDDFFFEDIVEDSVDPEEDEESYEHEFEMEQYLDGYHEDFPEEDEVNPLVTAGIAVGLIVAAAIICAILWGVTHQNKQETADNSPAVENVDASVNTDGTNNVGNTQNTAGTAEPMDNGLDGADSDGVNGNDANGLAETQDSENEDGTENDDTENGAVDHENNGGDAESGNVPGDGVNTTQEETSSMEEPISGTTDMVFTEVSETVTSKDITNIRTAPSTQDAYNIIGQLSNGETVTRTGVNDDTGWSRIEYEGQTAYAVTRYLTTDLSYTPPVAQSNANRVNTLDGRVIIFVDCDDYITPKEYVNLRTEPSTSEGNATVSTQISSGTVVHRTGMSPDAGWSRLDVNGQVLYVVSSYMQAAEQTTQE